MSDTANERQDFVCPSCDWIGSPEVPPDECPECGAPVEPLEADE